MKVTGFTFIRNAIKYDLPIVEAITSALPLCTDFVVAVGRSEDDTLQLVRSISSPKIRIIETVWDDSIRHGGRVLAVETGKAMDAINPDADWCFYIQADEIVHEDDLQSIAQAMQQHLHDPKVDGLLFNYLHFFGSYKYVGISPSLYKKEIRIIKNDKGIYPYRDAQGFRKGINHKLNVKQVAATIHHYGYVKEPLAMQRKCQDFGRLWRTDEPKIQKICVFDYNAQAWPVRPFGGSHPRVMDERIKKCVWQYEPDTAICGLNIKQRFKIWLEQHLGLNLSYTNYRLIG